MTGTTRPAGDLDIAIMTAADMEMALAWAAAEEWRPGLGDGPLYRSLDPSRFLVARRDGEPVATISVPAYDDTYAFVGYYIVPEQHRGRGYGHALWSAGLATAAPRTLGLDAIMAQVPNYRRSGFVLANGNVRFAGPYEGPTAGDSRIGGVDGEMDALVAFDALHLPARRDAFARAWIAAPGHHVRVARVDGRIVGYGVGRPSRDEFRIGPLFAEAPDIAEALLAALAGVGGQGATVMVDVPEPNAAAAAMYRRHGLVPILETARMYRGTAPTLPLDHIFALTSTEVG